MKSRLLGKRNTAILLSLLALMATGRHSAGAADNSSVVIGAASGAGGSDPGVSLRRMASAASGSDLLLNDVMIDGRLAAGRDVACRNCVIEGSVAAGHDVQLERCERVSSVSSGHDAGLIASRVLSHVSSGHNVILEDATVENGLQAGNHVEAQRSTIKGVLALGGHTLRLDASTADEIRFAGTGGGNYRISNSFNSGIIIGNSIIGNNSVIVGGNRIFGRSGSSHVSVGRNSLSSVNGYTIKGAPDRTTVITPDQGIYVNGRRVSGSGPKTYAEYAAANPGAPGVQGPGWADNGGDDVSNSGKSSSGASGNAVVNTLELVNNSVVSGPVVFESGYGEIRVESGSRFTGKVTNGRVVHI